MPIESVVILYCEECRERVATLRAQHPYDVEMGLDSPLRDWCDECYAEADEAARSDV